MEKTYSFLELSERDYYKALLKAQNTTFYNNKSRIEFLKLRKRSMKMFIVKQQNKDIALLMYQKISARSGAFLYFQHSPVFLDLSESNSEGFWQELYSFAKDQGKKNNVIYVRFTPRVEQTTRLLQILDTVGFQKAPVQEVDACITRVITISSYKPANIETSLKDTMDILKDQGFIVDIKDDAVTLESFMMMYKKIKTKQGETTLPFDYMKSELEAYLTNKELLTCICHDINGTVYAGAVVVLGKKCSWYYWALTIDKEESLAAQGLLLEELITYLKKNKCQEIDLWGESVTEEIYKRKLSHPWLTIDSFKRDFGSTLVTYITPIDIPINTTVYRASGLYQRFNMARRGYPYVTFEHDKDEQLVEKK